MALNPILQAINDIAAEKNISKDSVIQTIEAALAVAYRKDFGEKNQNVKVTFDTETAGARVFDVKTVVPNDLFQEWDEEQKKKEEERLAAEAAGLPWPPPEPPRTEAPVAPVAAAEGETPAEPELRFDPRLHIGLTEAKKLKKDAELGEEIRTELYPPQAYGRMAAQTAKQVIIQRLREAERDIQYKEFKGREGEMLTGTVQRVEGRLVFVDLGAATAIMPPPEQVDREHYIPGARIKVLLLTVNSTPKGPEIVVSRSHPEMVKKLFSLEVPEIASGAVEIRAISREPGSRTKIGVVSHQPNIDPVGSCVGQRGTRVQTVISELGGEKIDIIEWSDDPVKFITNALSPAKIISLKLNEEIHVAQAEVKEDQLSLAIGRAGQNVRLAAKLTGWKIDIVGEEKPPVEEGVEGATTEEVTEEASVETMAAAENKADETDVETRVDIEAKEDDPLAESPAEIKSEEPKTEKSE